MRVLAVTLALLVIFVGFAIWMQIDLTRTLADTANQADQALRDVEQAAWASARDRIDDMLNHWEGRRYQLEMVLVHSGLDPIGDLMVSAQTWARYEDVEQCALSLIQLKSELGQFSEHQQLRLENIL
ncbi:MAG: DUF4363 family protein [Christensenellales bacterium]